MKYLIQAIYWNEVTKGYLDKKKNCYYYSIRNDSCV